MLNNALLSGFELYPRWVPLTKRQGVAYKAKTYSGFCSMKQLGIFLLPLDVTPVCHRVFPHY